jgi:hypothetical protein
MLTVILWAIAGGLWRRMFGGWTGASRVACYSAMIPLCAPAHMLIHQQGWVLPWAVLAALAVTAACLLFFVVSFYPGGKFVDDRDVLLKYGPFGLGYVWAHRYWRDEWNRGGFIDGSNAVGEILLGASFWGSVGLLWLWVV